MQHNPLASALSALVNAENASKEFQVVKPASKLLLKVLSIMQDARYVGSFEKIENGRGGLVKVMLIGAINKCGVVSPRLPLKAKEYEKFEKRFLPAKNLGLLIVSTSKGLMPHRESKTKNIGGKLIAYVY